MSKTAEKKRIVILGCENSHARTFLGFMAEGGRYAGIEVAGVYSRDRSAAEKLSEQFGVPVMDTCGELAGRVDGVIVTARHGGDHLGFAAPYLSSGVPLFMDKPITVSTGDAEKLVSECARYGVRVTGGSCCVHCEEVRRLKKAALGQAAGRTLSGSVRAPLNSDARYGGFFFYAQHLIEIMMEIFGRYPAAVSAETAGGNVFAVFDYGAFTVFASFLEGGSIYRAEISGEREVLAEHIRV